MKPSTRWILGLAVVGLAFAGVQGLQKVTASTVASSVRMAPDFSLPHYQGRQSVRLSDLKGKVVVVNFYETSCPYCRTEMDAFDRVYRELKGRGLEIVAVSLDQEGLLDGARQVSSLARQYKVTFPMVIGNDEVAERYGGVDSVPMSFVVDRAGRLVRTFPGAIDGPTLKQAILPLL